MRNPFVSFPQATHFLFSFYTRNTKSFSLIKTSRMKQNFKRVSRSERKRDMKLLEETSRSATLFREAGDRDLRVEPAETAYERVHRLASANAVVLFSLSGCCMCFVVKRLLLGLGVGPTVYELDEENDGREMEAVLYQMIGNGNQPLPAVFIAGKLVGGLESVMTSHINGTLVPVLKEAGALWL